MQTPLPIDGENGGNVTRCLIRNAGFVMSIAAGFLTGLLLMRIHSAQATDLTLAHVRKLAASNTRDIRDPLDKFSDEMFDWSFKAWRLRSRNLDDTMLSVPPLPLLPLDAISPTLSPSPRASPRAFTSRPLSDIFFPYPIPFVKAPLLTPRWNKRKTPGNITHRNATSLARAQQEQVKLRSCLMLSVYGAMGAFGTFLPVFLATHKITPAQTGALLSMQRFVGMLVNPWVSVFADMYRKHKCVMIFAAVAQSVLTLCLLLPNLGISGIAIVLFVLGMFNSHIMTFMDASAIAAVGDRYGNIRLWGSIGVGTVAFVAGCLASLSGDLTQQRSTFDRIQGHDFVASFAVASFLYVLSIPGLARMNVKALWDRREVGTTVPTRPSALAFIRKVISMRIALFYIVIFLSGISNAVIAVFLYMYLRLQGASTILIGTSKLLACLAEVVFFKFSNVLRQRWGVAGCLAAAQVAYAARFVWYSNIKPLADLISNKFGIPGNVVLWGAVPSEILQGLTQALFWSTVSQFAASISPEGMRSTSQTVASTMHWLLGFGVGANLGGILFTKLGGRPTFKVMAGLSSANVLLCLVGGIVYGKQWDKLQMSKTSTATTISMDEKSPRVSSERRWSKSIEKTHDVEKAR